MEALVPFLPAGADLRALITTIASKCTSKSDAQALSTVCRQDPSSVSLVVEGFLAPNSPACRQVLPVLMHDFARVSSLVWDSLASRLNGCDEEETAQYYLHLIEHLVSQSTTQISGALADALYQQLSIDSDELANMAACILNMREYPEGNCLMWWNQIQTMIQSPLLNGGIAYKAWLSWARHGPSPVEFCKSDTYWQLIQQGIIATPRSTERIRYCLQILSLSLEHCSNEALHLEFIKWDPKSKSCRAIWTRYIALTEIISLDLSYNQADESRDDLFTLCQDPMIPASWALSVLKSGLSTQAENIRSFIVDAVMQFPDLAVFNHDVEVLVKNLLPLASAPSRFTVQDGVKCDYIDIYGDFIQRVVRSLSHENKVAFFECLLNDYQQTVYAYDCPRLIVIDAVSKFDSLDFPRATLELLGMYANSARRVSKSRALGGMIFRKGVEIFVKSLDLQLLPLYFPTLDTFPYLDIVLPHVTEAHKQELEDLARQKAVYYVLYYLKWGNLDLDSHPQADLVAAHLQVPILENAILEMCKDQLDSGCLTVDTRNALEFVPVDLKVPAILCGTVLEQAVAQMQLSSWRAPCHKDAIEELEREYTILTSSERLLNAQRVQYALKQLSDDWQRALPLLEQAFSFDYKPTQLSVLEALRRYLAAGQVSASQDLASTLISMWSSLCENGLRASDRDLQLDFIATIYSEPLFKQEHLSEALEKIASDIVKQGYARKNLLVPLVKRISSHSVLPLWANKVLVEAYTLIRTHHDVFYLENIILEKLQVYSEYWGQPDRFARAIAIQKLASTSDAEQVASIVLQDRYKLFYTTAYHDGDEECVRILCFQILVLLEPKWSHEFLQRLVPFLVQAVDNESSKYVRIYIEWLLTLAILSDPAQLDSVVLDPLRSTNEPRFVSSLGRVGLQVGKAMGQDVPADYWNNYAQAIVPLSTCNKAAVRHFSVAMVYALSLNSTLSKSLDPAVYSLIKSIAQCASSAEQFSNFKQGDDCIFDVRDRSLQAVCGGAIEKLYKWDARISISPETFAGDARSHDASHAPAQSTFAAVTTIRDCATGLTDNIQTKSGAAGHRTELIVVASLCDIAVNLGGICRLSDALGVKLLTLDDLKVVKSAHFKNTAVTSDRWMPLEQVKQDDIAKFMLEKKREGYTLVGLEQTDNSYKLEPSLKFPAKTLLLIGRERLGIPGSLLAYLDFCVEIEQFGVVRSMNVQTATAVIVHAYNHQH